LHENVFFQHIDSPHIKACFLKALEAFTPLHSHSFVVMQIPKLGYTMRAQPLLDFRILSKKRRAYKIDVNDRLSLEDVTKLEDLPEQVLVGWFAHELGHILDYQQRSALGMLWFGICYLIFPTYRLGAERRADLYAIAQGMADHLLVTKKYILHHSNLPAKYLQRIEKYYMSIEEVDLIVAASQAQERTP